MKKINLKKAMTIVLAMILALIPTFSAFAEAAKETGSEGGRTIIVQELKLGDAGASASVTRGETTFAPAAVTAVNSFPCSVKRQVLMNLPLLKDTCVFLKTT